MGDLRTAIEVAIKGHCTPTIGRGHPHGGQAGYIIYERDGLPFVIAEIEREVVAPLIAERNALTKERDDARADRERLKAECEAHETQSATIIQNYFDIGRELGAIGSPFEAVMRLKADRDKAVSIIGATVFSIPGDVPSADAIPGIVSDLAKGIVDYAASLASAESERDRLAGEVERLRAALRDVREFVADEVENRDGAGGDASDYVNDAKRALEAIDGVI